MNRNIERSGSARNKLVSGICSAITLAAVMGFGGCSVGVAPIADNAGGSARQKQSSPRTPPSGGHAESFRMRLDVPRGRYWVLGPDHVSLYGVDDERLIGRTVLPGWYVAALKGLPDMVLDQAGAAVISSNVVPTLWRVDPDSFKVTRLDITLQSKEYWDIGFTGLALAADGTLFGVTTLTTTLWNIKLDQARATPIKLSSNVFLTGAYALAVYYPASARAASLPPILCLGSAAGLHRIDLSADASSGRVSEESCDRN